jgi:hypothetical protein
VYQLDQVRVGVGPEELHQPRVGGGQLDLGAVAGAGLLEHEVDAERRCTRLLELGDAIGERDRVGALQHAQSADAADRNGQLGGHHAAPHGASWIGMRPPTSPVNAVGRLPGTST